MQRESKFLLAGVLALLVFAGGGIAWVVGILASHPDFTQLRGAVKVPIQLANKAKSFRWVGPKASGWVPMRAISNHLLMAVIASEDTSFFSHQGIDFHELKEAIKKDIEEKRWARGASTLTQQVVKNVYLTQEKTITRKVREMLWARELDKTLSKAEILCFYVNMAEWAPGVYGIGEAARYYFQKSPAELTAKESAFLAILLPAPRKYYIYSVRKQLTPWALSRIEHVLRVMNRMGFLDSEAYELARQESLWGETVVEMTDAEEKALEEVREDTALPPGEGEMAIDVAPSSAPQVEGAPTPSLEGDSTETSL